MDITKDIIDEAKRLSIENGVTMIVYGGDFERSIFMSGKSKSDRRDLMIDEALEYPDREIFDKFYIDSWYKILNMPSMETLYDTMTDSIYIDERINKIYKFLKSIGFSRFGDVDVVPGIENSFINQNTPGFILRVKPNLMIEIVSIIDGESKRYFFFYDPKQILDISFNHSNIEYKRDLKIELINNK